MYKSGLKAPITIRPRDFNALVAHADRAARVGDSAGAVAPSGGGWLVGGFFYLFVYLFFFLPLFLLSLFLLLFFSPFEIELTRAQHIGRSGS